MAKPSEYKACRLCSRNFERVKPDKQDPSICRNCRALTDAYARASGGRRAVAA